MPVSINFIAVVVAAIANMIVGSFWYSPIGFGKQWMHLVGLNQEKVEETKKKGMGATYAAMFAFTLISSYVLAHFVNYVDARTANDGLQLGIWVWLGFVVTTSAGDYLFAKRPWKLYYINAGYYLVNLVLAAMILSVWR